MVGIRCVQTKVACSGLRVIGPWVPDPPGSSASAGPAPASSSPAVRADAAEPVAAQNGPATARGDDVGTSPDAPQRPKVEVILVK